MLFQGIFILKLSTKDIYLDDLINDYYFQWNSSIVSLFNFCFFNNMKSFVNFDSVFFLLDCPWEKFHPHVSMRFAKYLRKPIITLFNTFSHHYINADLSVQKHQINDIHKQNTSMQNNSQFSSLGVDWVFLCQFNCLFALFSWIWFQFFVVVFFFVYSFLASH